MPEKKRTFYVDYTFRAGKLLSICQRTGEGKLLLICQRTKEVGNFKLFPIAIDSVDSAKSAGAGAGTGGTIGTIGGRYRVLHHTAKRLYRSKSICQRTETIGRRYRLLHHTANRKSSSPNSTFI